MELNRRNFIQFLVGGVAGIQITPLPWKITDDIAIWTQNWPWVPVPPEGEFNHEESVCKLCPGGCGIQVRKVDDRAVKIEGRTDYPVNPGGICPVGMGGLQLLYDESIRFSSPMKRVGPREAGQFVNITWEEALSTLAGLISDLRKQGRTEGLVAVDGNAPGSTMSLLIERFLAAVGSPNYMRIPTGEDTYRMASYLMQGTQGPMAYDLENADYILSFGCGLLEGWGAPGRVLNAWGLWHENPLEKKTRVVQVEPRSSNTASKADQWVAPRPGTDAALALGLAHVMIKEGLCDARFVAQYTFGFDDWTSAEGSHHTGFKTMVLNQYSPQKVAQITGLEPRDIVSLARSFAKAKAPIAICGKGKGDLNGSLYESMAVLALNALAGRINRPGGVLVYEPLPLSPLPGVTQDAVTREGLKKPRLDRAETVDYPFAHSLINNFTDAVFESRTSPVDALLVFSANPVFTVPDGGKFLKALTKIPFIVSFSPFRDETAYMADLILPDHTYLEKRDDVVWPAGLQYPLYGLTKPVVRPVYKTKNTGDVIIKLAKQIGGPVKESFAWGSYDDVLKTRAKGLFEAGGGLVSYDGSEPAWKDLDKNKGGKPGYKSFDDMWKKMRRGGLWFKPSHTFNQWAGVFKTPTGKFEFFSTQVELALHRLKQKSGGQVPLKALGVKAGGDLVCLPHYEATGAEKGALPLVMVPYQMINLASGWLPNPPFLYKSLFDNQLLKDESFAEINPETADQYGLKEGDMVSVASPAGSVQVKVHLFEGAMPGVVFLPLGFGHTAYDEFLQGKGVNPNNIILAAKDPLSGHPVWWDTPVKLTKV